MIQGSIIIVRGGRAHKPGRCDARSTERDPPAAEFSVHFEGRQSERPKKRPRLSLTRGRR